MYSYDKSSKGQSKVRSDMKTLFESLGLEYVGRQDVGGGRSVILFNFGDHTLA